MGTVAANVLEHGTGALNIDGCRVGHQSEADRASATPQGRVTSNRAAGAAPDVDGAGRVEVARPDTSLGRWPANTLLTHAADCVQIGEDFEQGKPASLTPREGSGSTNLAMKSGANPSAATPVFSCVEHCPVYRMDEQQDGASRYFTQTEWDPTWDAPFIYQAKPSKRERNAGLDKLPKKISNEAAPPGSPGANSPRAGANRNGASSNHHPTVKPVALMRHLVRLVTPPGGTVLDPFLGSGTTAVAAILEGFNWVGCEMTNDYLPIIKGRVTHAKKETAKQAQQQQLPGLETP